jgi:peroxiredoxin 2/4
MNSKHLILIIMKKNFASLVMAVFIIGNVVARENKIPLIGSEAPSFKARSTNGEITFPENFGDSWKILFSHPQDFTPVCTSELLEMAFLQSDFEKLGVKVAVISVDKLDTHHSWKAHLEDMDYKSRGKQKISFPIIEDPKAMVSEQYGMLHEQAGTSRDIRGVFIIDPRNIIRSVNFYPMEVGRNMEEIKRLVVALQLSDKENVITPANWKNGEDVLIPHFPYTAEQLSANPEIKNDYYNMGGQLWFKKSKK